MLERFHHRRYMLNGHESSDRYEQRYGDPCDHESPYETEHHSEHPVGKAYHYRLITQGLYYDPQYKHNLRL